jgi:hypothetical protein
VGAVTTGGWRVGRWLTVGGLLVASLTVAACSPGTCSSVPPTLTIQGRLVAREGSTATFVIGSVPPPTNPRSSTRVPPVLKPGQTVAVEYYGDTAKFLDVGTRYRVALYWSGSRFESAVHTADSCSGGTVYADGRSIDTRSWGRAHLREIIAVVLLVPLALFLAFAASLKAIARLTRANGRRRVGAARTNLGRGRRE